MELIKQLQEQSALSQSQKLIQKFLGAKEDRVMMANYMADVLDDAEHDGRECSIETAAQLAAAEHLEIEPHLVDDRLVQALVNNYDSFMNKPKGRPLKDIIHNQENEEIQTDPTLQPGDPKIQEFLKISQEQLNNILNSISNAVKMEDDSRSAAEHALTRYVDWFAMAPQESQENMIAALTSYWEQNRESLLKQVDPYHKGS